MSNVAAFINSYATVIKVYYPSDDDEVEIEMRNECDETVTACLSMKDLRELWNAIGNVGGFNVQD